MLPRQFERMPGEQSLQFVEPDYPLRSQLAKHLECIHANWRPQFAGTQAVANPGDKTGCGLQRFSFGDANFQMLEQHSETVPDHLRKGRIPARPGNPIACIPVDNPLPVGTGNLREMVNPRLIRDLDDVTFLKHADGDASLLKLPTHSGVTTQLEKKPAPNRIRTAAEYADTAKVRLRRFFVDSDTRRSVREMVGQGDRDRPDERQLKIAKYVFDNLGR